MANFNIFMITFPFGFAQHASRKMLSPQFAEQGETMRND
jgi:hypothetical protein